MLLGEIAEAKGASWGGLRILRDLEEKTTYISVVHPHPPPQRLSPDGPESAPCRAPSYHFHHSSTTLCNVWSHQGFQAFQFFSFLGMMEMDITWYLHRFSLSPFILASLLNFWMNNWILLYHLHAIAQYKPFGDKAPNKKENARKIEIAFWPQSYVFWSKSVFSFWPKHNRAWAWR